MLEHTWSVSSRPEPSGEIEHVRVGLGCPDPPELDLPKLAPRLEFAEIAERVARNKKRLKNRIIVSDSLDNVTPYLASYMHDIELLQAVSGRRVMAP